jgi:hypothetical protein
MARRHTLGWGQPTPGWGQPFPGWDPLPDPGPLPVRAASSLGRWWWPLSATVGFLAVVGYVFRHDDPRPGLSTRSWLTLALAAVVVVLLTVHRAASGRPPRAPLARALAEYAVVALLAVLLATASGPPPAQRVEGGAGRRQATERPTDPRPPAEQDRRPPAGRADASGADRRPGIVRVVTGAWGWLVELWQAANQQGDPSTPPSTTTPEERR